MNKRGITFKLFIMTVVFFLCFYGMVILSQLLFLKIFIRNRRLGVWKAVCKASVKVMSRRLGDQEGFRVRQLVYAPE